jgi:hypothetical protein
LATSEAQSPSKGLTIEVAYRFSLWSFLRATHAAWRSQLIFQLLGAMLVLLWIASSFVVGLGARVQDQLPTLAFTVIAVTFYFLYPVVAFARNPKHRAPRRFEFAKDAFTYKLGDTEATLSWRDLKAAVETREFYVLDLPRKQKVAVPKSAFAPGAEQRFRLLAATSGVPIH